MNKLITKALETERTSLRKLEVKDSAQLFENVFSDYKVAQYMSWKRYSNEEQVKNYLSEWQKQYDNNEGCYWGIFLKESGILIGTVYLYTENDNASVGFISYCLGSEFWGNGYMTEAVKAVLKYGFDELKYNIITTFVAKSNQRSQHVLSRLGFKAEAVLRMRDKTAFGYEDCLVYSLLADEMNF